MKIRNVNIPIREQLNPSSKISYRYIPGNKIKSQKK